MNGLNGLQSWRWLFIIEAAVTVFIAICAMFILPDYPHSTRSFTPLERAIAVNRMRHSSGAKDEERGSPIQGLRVAVTDYKTWLLALIIITKTSAGVVTSFIPTVINTFGYSKVITLLLVAPVSTLITKKQHHEFITNFIHYSHTSLPQSQLLPSLTPPTS